MSDDELEQALRGRAISQRNGDATHALIDVVSSNLGALLLSFSVPPSKSVAVDFPTDLLIATT